MNFLYQYHDLGLLSMGISRMFSGYAKAFLQDQNLPFAQLNATKAILAELDSFERVSGKLEKPKFGIDDIHVNDKTVKIQEEILLRTPFCSLRHFMKVEDQKEKIKKAGPKKEEKKEKDQEKLLIVAPLSGHFATLLRNTVLALLPHFDVYITDWEDAAQVPLSHGPFGLDDYVQYLLDSLEFLGPDVNLLGVCQPVVPVLIATALTHQLNLPIKPKSMILMGGPVDTRINPTKINMMSKSAPLSFYEQFILSEVPNYYPGAGRRVCPGFMMLLTFMGMNPDKHLESYSKFITDAFEENGEKVKAHQKFYNEYLAVMDLHEKYFLDCIHHIFHEHTLPKGLYEWKGTKIDLASITKTALMTIEGEHDDISGLGQTKAAHDLCINIPKKIQGHYQNPDVGHYGIFSGHRWREIISPKIVEFIERL